MKVKVEKEDASSMGLGVIKIKDKRKYRISNTELSEAIS